MHAHVRVYKRMPMSRRVLHSHMPLKQRLLQHCMLLWQGAPNGSLPALHVRMVQAKSTGTRATHGLCFMRRRWRHVNFRSTQTLRDKETGQPSAVAHARACMCTGVSACRRGQGMRPPISSHVPSVPHRLLMQAALDEQNPPVGVLHSFRSTPLLAWCLRSRSATCCPWTSGAGPAVHLTPLLSVRLLQQSWSLWHLASTSRQCLPLPLAWTSACSSANVVQHIEL